MFCEADRLRQKMELYLDHERDADGESLNLTEKQKQQLIAKQGPPEFRAALQAACDAILKMYMLCPPDMRGFITVPTPPWMKE
jgi:hypothetical protein